GDADRESRNTVKEEGVAVVVEDHHCDVGLGFLHPFLASFIAVEERLPICGVAQTLVECSTNGRNMAGTQPTNNLSHLHAFPGVRRGSLRGSCQPVPRRSWRSGSGRWQRSPG